MNESRKDDATGGPVHIHQWPSQKGAITREAVKIGGSCMRKGYLVFLSPIYYRVPMGEVRVE